MPWPKGKLRGPRKPKPEQPMPDDAEGQRLPPPNLDQYAFRAELDKAIAVEREKMMAEMTEQFAALAASMQRPQAPGTVGADGSISALAVQLAELTGQGQGRIYVAPDVIEKRRAAFVELEALLIELHRKSNRGRNEEFVPAYRLTNKVQLNLGRELGEALIDPIYRERGTNLQRDREIYWQGIPNFAMQPINEPAERVHALFSAWTGNIMAQGAAPDALMALTAQEEMPRRPDAPEEGEEGLVAMIRQTPTDTKKVQVYGKNTMPVEVS
jgi:hypothetical protein